MRYLNERQFENMAKGVWDMKIQDNGEYRGASTGLELCSEDQLLKEEDLFPELKSAIPKVKELRIKEYKSGFDFILKNVDKIGLGALEIIAYTNDEEILFDHLPNLEIAGKILGYDKIDNEFVNIHYIASENFIQGMEEASKMVLEKSEQSTDELLDEIISKAQQDMPDGLESLLQ